MGPSHHNLGLCTKPIYCPFPSLLVGQTNTVEYDGLDGEPRSEPEEHSPVEPLTGGLEPVLDALPPHLVQDKDDASTGHVTVLAQHVPGGPELLGLELELSLDLVQDGRAARMRYPEDRVPVRDAQGPERLHQALLDVLRDQAGDVFQEVEGQADLAEVPIDGPVAVREDRLGGRDQLVQRLLHPGYRVRPDYDGGRAVPEQGLANEAVQVGVARAAEGDGGDLGADYEDPGAPVVLGQVLGHPEDSAAGEAALLVHHEALDRGAEAEELGQLVVGARHVDAAGGAEDQVGDLGLGLAPLLDGLLGGFLTQLGNLHHHHVLPGVQ